MASYNNNPYTNGLYPVPFSSNGGGSDPSTLSLNASNSNDIDALCTPWSQGITPSRKFQNCPTLGQDFTIPELRLTCPHCGLFFVRCCHRTYRDERDDACHHFHIIMTDGACLDNGSVSTAPVAGLGIAFGDNNERHQQLSIPVTDDIDKPNLTQTSQRAELLAAIHGLKSLHHEENNQEHHGLNRRLPQDPAASNISAMKRRCYIITTDSKYVVDGMTEWLSVWKVNGFKTSKGVRPANLELFLKLEEEIGRIESFGEVKVGFWWIPREHNSLADSLAKMAAREMQNRMRL